MLYVSFNENTQFKNNLYTIFPIYVLKNMFVFVYKDKHLLPVFCKAQNSQLLLQHRTCLHAALLCIMMIMTIPLKL